MRENVAIQSLIRIYNKFLFAPVFSSRDWEDELERNLVWVFSLPRSGSSWFAQRLLGEHGDVVVWDEPYIGAMVGAGGFNERHYDRFANRRDFIFSDFFMESWVSGLRRLILSQARVRTDRVSRKIVIKEPNGCHGSDIVMKCMPGAKLIFLSRDGRDFLDSVMARHRKGSWSGAAEHLTPEARMDAIRHYSEAWCHGMKVIGRAYENHDPNLRLLVKYEDLRLNTAEVIQKAYDFIGLDTDDKKIIETVRKHDYENVPMDEKGPLKPIRTAMVGGWKDNFSRDEKDLMHSVMRETLAGYGYEV
jgi:hypothetical protein